MEENIKEKSANKQQRCFFCRKIQIPIFGVLIIVVFISLVTYGFVSLNNRLKTLEEKKPIESVSTISQEITAGRTKRSPQPTKMEIILKKLNKMEERCNQSYHAVARQPVFVLRSLPGKPGKDGVPGKNGKPGRDGIPGQNGVPGQNGKPGRDGTRGVPGTKGQDGRAGRDGAKGQGVPGTKGQDGKDGREGAKGPKGDQGTPSQQGPQGISGQKGNQGNPGVSGVSYIRWGKKTCPYTGAKLVYEGYVGGSLYDKKGGGSNYVCLSRNPTYENYQGGVQSVRSYIYGAEYQTYSTGIFPSSLHDHEVPCVRCHVNTRATQMMIPGRNVCPAGWTREYKGYLMAEKHSHHRTMHTCVDENPDYVPGTHGNRDGALFYFVEGRCGSLPCKPYVEGRELTCAVCTR